MQLCWLVLVLRGHGLLIVMSKTQPSSIIVPGFICESVVACWHNQHRELPAPADVACSASRFGQLVLHVEKGLLKIFLSVCGSSTPAPSCQDERRRQMSFAAAAAVLLHVSKLCKGMSSHNEVRHVSTRLHIHRFRPWAPVRLPGVCFLTNACGSPKAHFERFCLPAGWSCGTRA